MRCFFIGVLLALSHTPAPAQQSLADSVDMIFTKIPLTAEFKGGEKAWIQFLSKNLRFPEDSIASKAFKGKVVVQFVVSQTGRVTDVKVINTVDSTLAAEVMRVVTLSDGRWTPAVACGRLVKSYKTVALHTRTE